MRNTRMDFTPNARLCYVCDGHFTEDSFNQAKKLRFNAKLLTQAELRPDSVPSIKFATPTHFPKEDKDVPPMSRS